MNKKSSYRSRKRTSQIEAGAYDGRYRTKVVEDKKKLLDKKFCRIYKNSKENE